MDRVKLFVCSKVSEFRTYRQYINMLFGDTNLFEILLFPETATAGHPEKARRYRLLEESDIIIFLIGKEHSEETLSEIDFAIEKSKQIVPLFMEDIDRESEWHKKVLNRVGPIQFASIDKLESFRAELTKSVSSLMRGLLHAQYDIVSHTSSKAELYDEMADIVNNAKRHIILLQDTSSLFLGPRNTMDPEKECLNIITEKMKNDNNIKLVHIYNNKSTEFEWEHNIESYDVEYCKLLYSLRNKIKDRCDVYSTDDKFTPALITESEVAISVSLGDNFFGIVRDMPVARAYYLKVMNYVDKMPSANKMTLEEFLKTRIMKYRSQKKR